MEKYSLDWVKFDYKLIKHYKGVIKRTKNQTKIDIYENMISELEVEIAEMEGYRFLSSLGIDW